MLEKDFTMQSEEIENAAPCPGTMLLDKMTYTKNSTIINSETLPQPIKDELVSCSPSKFDNINLEDDIERVEVDSNEDSSNSEEQIQDDRPEFIPIPDFSTIPEQNPNDTIKNWLQKITEIQNEAIKKTVASTQNTQQSTSSASTSTPATRVVKYQDLPYMGEITLDNSKPRRGRKPKKADICHLIYKNYGTIFPGTPNASSYLEKDSHSSSNKNKSTTGEKEAEVKKNDVQNKIISSLLEKRLTQESKRSLGAKSKDDHNEPLNLCIRDLNQLKIRLLNKNDHQTPTPDIKSEPQSDDDIEIVTESPSSTQSVRNELRFPSMTPDNLSTSSQDTANTPEGQSGPGGYVYWPNAGVFIHPMALQQQLMMYQRLAGNVNYTLPSHSPRPPPSASETKSERPDNFRKIVPKLPKPNETSEASHEAKPKRTNSSSCEKTPAKRKRSAIFIPPIPTENTTNPATEVSICKFKFTGGAKPSLQEKKMLSVDSGGNFRYYSGTGDKSMRGYEFFPRETLQQQVTNSQGSSTGAFLQASGEKIYPVPPFEAAGTNPSSDFLLNSKIPASSLAAIQHQVNTSSSGNKNKKRKSKKSIQREKLEKTFKEKGFLIQTQQLESAEGATYCKFRQLRKFTRYLFRSWKDYLPGNVKELSESEQRELQERGGVDVPTESKDSVSVKSEEVGGTS